MKFNVIALRASVLLAAVLLLFSGCKKYDEGPLMSLKSAEKRIPGVYKCTKWEDTSGGSTNDNTADHSDEQWTLTEEKTLSYDLKVSAVSVTATGTWSLQNDEATLRLVYTYSILGIPFNFTNDYTILRLTNKEMFLQYVNGSTTSRIELTKQK